MRKRTDDSMRSGARLRIARSKKRWSRPDLEKATGIPVNTIRQYEEGRCLPSAPRLVLLAEALGVEEKWLVPVEKEGEK